MDHLNQTLKDMLDLDIDIEEEKENANKKATKAQAQAASKSTAVATTDTEEKHLQSFVPAVVETTELTSEQNKSDKELARASIRNLLNQANDSIGALFYLAKQTEHPRAFEVAATIAKTIIDAADKLDNMSEEKAAKGTKMAPSDGNGGTNISQQNNIIMSSEEAMRLLRNKMANEDGEVVTEL